MSNLHARIALAMLAGLGVMAGTYVYLRPSPSAAADYKFVHCDKCRQELTYSAELVGKRCARCPPLKGGTLVPTTKSINEGSENPWRAANIALSFEAVFLLGVVVFLLYHPPKSRGHEYWRTRCPNCKRRLRFPPSRAGGEGRCPGCKHIFGYPLFSEETVR